MEWDIAHDVLDAVLHAEGRSHGHRGFHHDDFGFLIGTELLDRVPDIVGRAVDEGHVRMAPVIGRRSHADEDHVGRLIGMLLVERVGQPPRLAVLDHQLGQPRLIDRADIVLELLDFAGIDIKTDHIVSCVGEAHTGDQTHISCTHHRQLHRDCSSVSGRSLDSESIIGFSQIQAQHGNLPHRTSIM